jgi:hypothetical protein
MAKRRAWRKDRIAKNVMFFGHPPFFILIRFLEEFWRMFSIFASDQKLVSLSFKSLIN